MPESLGQDKTKFEGVNPIFRVHGVEASVAYYTSALGCKVDWQTPGFASVSRGPCAIFLLQGDPGHAGGWAWVGVGHADVLAEEYRRTGAKIRHEPTNYPWACERQVEDLDGHVLRFGPESKREQPTGEWLDRRGERPVTSNGSEWTRVGAS